MSLQITASSYQTFGYSNTLSISPSSVRTRDLPRPPDGNLLEKNKKNKTLTYIMIQTSVGA